MFEKKEDNNHKEEKKETVEEEKQSSTQETESQENLQEDLAQEQDQQSNCEYCSEKLEHIEMLTSIIKQNKERIEKMDLICEEIGKKYSQAVTQLENMEKVFDKTKQEIEERSLAKITKQITMLMSDVVRIKNNMGPSESPDVIGLVDIIYEVLLNTLNEYRIEIITPKVGDIFDSSFCKVLGTVQTKEEEKDKVNTIHTVIHPGYKIKNILIQESGVLVYV